MVQVETIDKKGSALQNPAGFQVVCLATSEKPFLLVSHPKFLLCNGSQVETSMVVYACGPSA